MNYKYKRTKKKEMENSNLTATLFVKSVDDVNSLKDPGVKYSQFILLIKSLVDSMKLSNRPVLTLIKEYKKVVEILLTIKNFIFDPSYKPAISLITNKVISTPEKVAEVEDMIKTAKDLKDNTISIPTESISLIENTTNKVQTSLPNINRKFKKK